MKRKRHWEYKQVEKVNLFQTPEITDFAASSIVFYSPILPVLSAPVKIVMLRE